MIKLWKVIYLNDKLNELLLRHLMDGREFLAYAAQRNANKFTIIWSWLCWILGDISLLGHYLYPLFEAHLLAVHAVPSESLDDWLV